MAVTRKASATWVIPTEDEWYKAAYFDPNKPGGAGYWTYPTQSDAPPINTLLSPDPGNHANFNDYYHTGNGTFTIGFPYYRTRVGAFANSGSAYGTFDQGGNLWEWNEANVRIYLGDPDFGYRGMRGGSFISYYSNTLAASVRDNYYPSGESFEIGFRVAYVPEPGSITLLVAGAVALLICSLRRHA
jgi:formylglycine-generating enzyme required for sulfatase activity